MGCYSELIYENIAVVVDKEELNSIQKTFSDSNNKDIYGFRGVNFKTTDIDSKTAHLNIVELDDEIAKFYDERFFADKMSRAIVSGRLTLYFIGEDGGKWGYRVEKGKVTELVSVMMTVHERKLYRELLGKK